MKEEKIEKKSAPWPIKIEYSRKRKQLAIQYDDGAIKIHSAESLRINSPSAEVQGHHPSQRKKVEGKEAVSVTAMHPIGNYAVRLVFDDGHQTGIYSWNFLYHLSEKGKP